MKNEHKIIVSMFMILICMPFITGFYNFTGEDEYLRPDITRFNNALDTDLVKTIGLSVTTQRLTPLSSDLDRDGIQEIIILDAGTVKIIQVDVSNSQFDIIDSFTFPASQRTSNMIIFDIDGDDKDEIIIHLEQTTNSLEILEFNGTDLINESSIDVSGLVDYDDGESLIQCAAENDCIMVYMTKIQFQGGNTFIKSVKFNSTGTKGTPLTVGVATPGDILCLSNIRDMQVKDFDDDGNLEYLFSYIHVDPSAGQDESVNIVALSYNTTDTQIDDSRSINIGNLYSGTNVFCDGTGISQSVPPGNSFTNPLVDDWILTGGLETAIAYQDSSINDFKIYLYDQNLDFVDDFPEVGVTSGVIISNVFKQDFDNHAFFCVIGLDTDQADDFLSVLCGSKQLQFGIFEHVFFDFPLSGLSDKYNISADYGDHFMIAHSIDALQNGDFLEFVNSYGVFEGTSAGVACAIFRVCDLELLYENPKIDAVVIPDDYEQNGLSDLLVYTDTNFWYLDDGFTNTPSIIDEYSINPCIESIWKENTTLEVQITPVDVDGDDVSARVILYHGSENAQDTGWATNASSGTTFIFRDEFTVNKTQSNGVLRLMSFDTENMDSPDIIDLIFSVSTNGVIFGDCITTADGLSTIDDEVIGEFDPTETDLENNAVTTGIRGIGELFHLSELLIWIFIMGVTGIALWMGNPGSSAHPIESLGLIFFIEFLFVLFGVYLGFIPIGLIITLVVIAVVIIGLWIARWFTASSGSS